MGKQSRQNKQDMGIQIDYMKFHSCVGLSKFEKERTTTFIPPDGQFQLMSYRISENINIPFKVNIFYSDIKENKLEIPLKIKSIYDKNIYGTNILVIFQYLGIVLGKAKHEFEEQSVFWRIKKLQGDVEISMNCEIKVGSTNNESVWSKPPLEMIFQIPMFTASGLRVSFLKVMEKSGYRAMKWIKHLTKGGQYFIDCDYQNNQ